MNFKKQLRTGSFFLLVMMSSLLGKAQVSLQTGSATFSLPMFSWKDNKSRLQTIVAASYSSGNGIKAGDVAGCMGQGWNLIAGGVITRIQVGEPDDQVGHTVQPETDLNQFPPGILSSHGSSAVNGCPEAMSNYPIYGAMNQQYARHNSVFQDRASDYFSFSFNGKAGMFILNPNPDPDATATTGTFTDQAFFIGDTKMKISYQTTNTWPDVDARTTIKSFTITDVDGLIYTFSAVGFTKVLKTEYCDNVGHYYQKQPKIKNGEVFYQTQYDVFTYKPWVATSWFLTSIKDGLTGREVTFTYNSNPQEVEVRAGEEITYNEEVNSPGDDKDYVLVSYKRARTRVPRLLQISTPDNHFVVFDYKGEPRADFQAEPALASVTMKYGTGYAQRVMSRFNINTTYIIDARYGTPVDDYQKSRSRLILKSIQKIGVDAKEDTPPYVFDYYLGGSAPDEFVPPPFFYVHDLWGFYNGSNIVGFDNGETIPLLYKGVQDLTFSQLKGLCFLKKVGGVKTDNKYCAKNGYAKLGLLQRVVYPTGGTITYEYAQNEGNINGSLVQGMGVRVSKTIATDASTPNACSNPLITNYSYKLENGASSLWGLEAPTTMVQSKNHYEPQSKYYRWSLSALFGECAYRFKYPGILSQQSAISLSDFANLMNNMAPVMGIISIISTIKDVATLLVMGGPSATIAVIVDVIVNLVQLGVTCLVDNTRDSEVSTYLTYDLNSINPLPTQFKRVEVVENNGEGGKTITEYTSDDDYNIWVPNNTRFGAIQRYAPWVYGLVKKQTFLDDQGRKVKELENTYVDSAHVKTVIAKCFIHPGMTCGIFDNTYLLSCNCSVKKTFSLRNDEWADASIYDNVATFHVSDYIVGSDHVIDAERYAFYTGHCDLLSSRTRTFDIANVNKFVESQTDYTYDQDIYVLKSTSFLDEKNTRHGKTIKYPKDFIYDIPFAQQLVDKNIITEPIDVINTLDKSNNISYVSEEVTEYQTLANGDLRPYRHLVQRTDVPKAGSSWYLYAGTSTNYSKYVVAQALTYDNASNLVQAEDEGGRVVSYQYAYNDLLTEATTVNAKAGEALFFGFEELLNTHSGNSDPFANPTLTLDDTRARTGKFSLNFSNPNGTTARAYLTKTVQSSALPTDYYVSGWVYSDGPSVTLRVGMSTTTSGSATSYSYDESISTSVTNSWVFVSKRFTVPSGVVDLRVHLEETGAGSVWIDDVRLHPFLARMTSTAYDPLIGKLGESDINNVPTKFEYDNLGRLLTVKDQDDNIVKAYEYNNVDPVKQQNGCQSIFKNNIISQAFVKTCGPGYQGTSVVFTVPADMFSSTFSKEDADAQAEFYLLANGQANADANGSCQLLYCNSELIQSFYSQACQEGEKGNLVQYTVPANRYCSITPGEADAMAQADADANGQAFANEPAHLSCSIDYDPHWSAEEDAPTECQVVNGQPYIFRQATDVNPNSSTYGQTSWQNTGEPGTCSEACDIYYENLTDYDQTLMLYDPITSTNYIYTLPAHSSGNLSGIPDGYYDINISSGYLSYNTYEICDSYYGSGWELNLYNQHIGCSCAFIHIM